MLCLLLIAGCSQTTTGEFTPSEDSPITIPTDTTPRTLMEVDAKTHWVYRQVLQLHQAMQELEPTLVDKTLANFDAKSAYGYELIQHREEIKHPQVYEDYQGYDHALLAIMMEYTLSEAEINNLHYYGFTSPDTLPGQLLMSWLMMYQPSDFFSAWYPDIPYIDDNFWKEVLTRYYGSQEFMQHMNFSGYPWLLMMEYMREEWEPNSPPPSPPYYYYWKDYAMTEGKAVQIRQALLLAQLINDYQSGKLTSGKLHGSISHFLSHHLLHIGFPSYYDDYTGDHSFARKWVEFPSQQAPVYHELYLSRDLMRQYQLDDVNTIPGQLLAIQFMDYGTWYEWDDAFYGNLYFHRSETFVEKKIMPILRSTYFDEVQNLLNVMREEGYQWRGKSNDPRAILEEATMQDPHPLYAQVMRLSNMMPRIKANSKKFVLDEIDQKNQYYIAVHHREKIGYPSDYNDYVGYDTHVVQEMLNHTFSPQGIARLKQDNLTTPDTVLGQLLIGWLLKEQPSQRFEEWYPDLSLALAQNAFWTEVLSRIYGSRSFVTDNQQFNALSGSDWLFLSAIMEKQLTQDEEYSLDYEMYWHHEYFNRELSTIVEDRRLTLLERLLTKDSINNEQVKIALSNVIRYHKEHIGLASDYDDFVLTQENQASSQDLVNQLRSFHIQERMISFDAADYGYGHLQFFGSKKFTYHLAKMDITDNEDLYELSANLKNSLKAYYSLLEELYTVVLEENYQ